MIESVTDIIVARSRQSQDLKPMVVWSIAIHALAAALIVLAPHNSAQEAPKTVMTISLGGSPGPRAGGMTQMGGRAIQAPAPPQPVRRAETAPAPTRPAMTLPDPKARTRPQPKPEQAPKDATGRTATTGPEPREGSAQADTSARGKGFGLSTGGGGAGGAVQLDVGNFCCPEYLEQMVSIIQRNWQQNHNTVGSTIMKFTIRRDGTIDTAQVEKTSGFYALDNDAQRALLLTARLPPLPGAFTNPSLTVHMRFDYQR
jgi:TonB family protein